MLLRLGAALKCFPEGRFSQQFWQYFRCAVPADHKVKRDSVMAVAFKLARTFRVPPGPVGQQFDVAMPGEGVPGCLGVEDKFLVCLAGHAPGGREVDKNRVSALAGRDHILSAYKEAVKERYRFFSFGDAMFIC